MCSLYSESVHKPVLLDEILEWSNVEKQSEQPRVFVDGTLGGGGHASALYSRLKAGDRLIGIDRDRLAVDRYSKKLQEADSTILKENKVQLIHGSYRDYWDWHASGAVPSADFFLLDLGLSSDQLEDRSRGFSFRVGGNLDMRFCTEEGHSAQDLLHRIDEKDLANLIFQYGEERFSRRIARAIVEARRVSSIDSAEQLAEIIHRCVPGRVHGRIDSATRTFQALRIAVNRELDHLEQALERLPKCLKPDGRILIISFHSLEDRMVKHSLKSNSLLKVLTKKPIIATENEIRSNPRSRSAKLRVAERRNEDE